MLLLTACADIKSMPAGGRYLLITRFGDGMTAGKIATTSLYNDYRVFPDETDLGKLFRDETIAILDKQSSWTRVPVDVPMDQPRSDGDYGDYRADVLGGDWHKRDARLEKIKEAARANHADLVIYITETANSTIIAGPFTSNEELGRGILKRSLIGIDDQNHAFISYLITVYDPHSWKSREYISTVVAPFPQFEWPRLSFPPKPLPEGVMPQAKQILAAIEPPPDLSFGLCYLGLTEITKDPVDHTRAYTCAQRLGLQTVASSYSNVPVYWLTHPVDPHHADLHQ